MERWQKDAKDWLSSEHTAADEAAEAAFARVFATLPVVEPSPEFVQRTVAAAWAAPARHRRSGLWLRVAAGFLLAAASSLALYGLALDTCVVVVSTAAVWSSRLIVWAVSSAAVGLDWWLITARVGNSLASVAATPGGIVALTAVQLVAASAFYVLRRLLAGDATLRHPRAFCF